MKLREARFERSSLYQSSIFFIGTRIFAVTPLQAFISWILCKTFFLSSQRARHILRSKSYFPSVVNVSNTRILMFTLVFFRYFFPSSFQLLTPSHFLEPLNPPQNQKYLIHADFWSISSRNLIVYTAFSLYLSTNNTGSSFQWKLSYPTESSLITPLLTFQNIYSTLTLYLLDSSRHKLALEQNN